jgi:hypothetical protein
MKKKIAIITLALAAALVPAGSALAVDPDTYQDFEAKSFAGSKPGKTPKAGSIGTYLHPFHNKTWPFVTDQSAGAMQVTPPFASVISYIYLDRNVTFNADPFPGCAKEKVLALNPSVKGAAAAGCPKESQIGAGEAAGFARAVGSAPGQALLTTELQTRTFASGIKNTIWLYTYNELTKGNVIVGTLQKYKDPTGRYGSRIRFVLPRGLIQPAPGVVSQLSTFDSTIPAQSYKGKHLTTLKKCPSGKKIWAGYQGTYSNNATPKPGVSPADGNDFVVTGTSKIISRSGKCK